MIKSWYLFPVDLRPLWHNTSRITLRRTICMIGARQCSLSCRKVFPARITCGQFRRGAERLPSLLPQTADICRICINGGFHNLATMQTAAIVKEFNRRVAIPCHYDMMINNVVSPEMLRVVLDVVGSGADFTILRYYEP